MAQVLQPAPGRLRPASPTGLSTPAGLPTEFIDQSRRRMAALSLVLGILFSVIGVLHVVLTLTTDLPGDLEVSSALRLSLASALIGASFGMYVLARKPDNATLVTCGLGLLYQLLVVFIAAFARYWMPRTADFMPIGVSFAGVLLLLFPLVAPHVSVRRAAFASLLSASMDPLALLVSTMAGRPMPELASGIALVAPTFACAGLAVLPAVVVHRLGRDMRRVQQLGSYQLIERIGTGGMGEVWRAQHRLLVRPAAIKLIRPEALGSGEAQVTTMKRFEREAQATAMLSSPHTIGLYDFGVAADGSFYYVMELLDGVDLETLVQRFGPVAPERAVHFLTQICESLIEAHEAGLVHRDIKPANVFTCRYGHRTDFIKVLDFGLVKQASAGIGPLSRLTGDQHATGTPAYMAPEASLARESIDHRVDLYALGCVGYFLLTGQLVFRASSAVEMAIKHVQEEPAAPSQLSEHAIPAELDEVILACLRKDPAERPASARELLARLDAVPLPRRWTSERADQWWQRHLPRRPVDTSSDRAGERELIPAA